MARGLLIMLAFFLAISTIMSFGTVGASILAVASASIPFNATFDFDTGFPPLVPTRNTPLNQTSGGVMASFTSPYDPNAFSIQTYSTTFIKLSEFSGNYLFDNLPTRNILEIQFNQSLNTITFTYATIEYHGGPEDNPTNITLTAYLGSVSTSPVGSASSHGTWPTTSAYPQGTLTFASSGQPFNLVRIELPRQGVAVNFFVDNIIVSGVSAGPEYPLGDSILNFPITVILLVVLIIAILIIVLMWRKKD